MSCTDFSNTHNVQIMHSWSLVMPFKQHFITNNVLCKPVLHINTHITALPSVVDTQGNTLFYTLINNHTVNTPASLASSSLGMPLILLCFTDEHFLFSCVWALNFTQLSILSTIPQLVACGWQQTKSFHWCPAILHEKPSEELKANEKCPYSPDKLVWQKALGPKALGLECHILLGLGVKAGVLDQCVHKHPDVVLHLKHKWEEDQSAFNTHLQWNHHSHLELEIFHEIICNPTWKGLTDTPALFFFFTTSISLDTIWSTT